MEPLYIAILVFAAAMAVNLASGKLFLRLVSALIMGWAAINGGVSIGVEIAKTTLSLQTTYKMRDLLKPIKEASDKGDCAQASMKLDLLNKKLGYVMNDQNEYLALRDALERQPSPAPPTGN